MAISSTFGCGMWSVCCVGVFVLIASSAMVREGGFVVVGSYFGHCFVTCPNSLHLQQFGWSVVTNTQYWISSHVTTKDRGIFYILVVWSLVCARIPVLALRKDSLETNLTWFLMNAFSKISFGIVSETFERIIRWAGLISGLISTFWLLMYLNLFVRFISFESK